MTQRHPHLRAIAYAMAYVLVGALVVGVLTVLVQTREVVGVVREQQKQSVARGKDIQATAQLIKDCTDPEGECYKQGQRRTAGAVADINRVVILAAACSVGVPPDLTVVDRQSLIQSCVIARLARENAGSRRP